MDTAVLVGNMHDSLWSYLSDISDLCLCIQILMNVEEHIPVLIIVTTISVVTPVPATLAITLTLINEDAQSFRSSFIPRYLMEHVWRFLLIQHS